MIIRFINKHDILFSLIITLFIILIFDLLGWTQNAKVMNWVAFCTCLCIIIFLEIVKGSKLRYKIMRPIGFSLLFCLVLFAELGTRYELQHQFFKPCWSPDGKQIAFFMNKGVYNYRWNMIGGWSPDTIWEKHYLCTMDYDGKNFKQIKQTEQATNEISWSSSGEIVYTQDIRLNVDIILQRKIIYTSVDGKETGMLYETAKIPTNDVVKGNERILDPWLSQDGRYLGFVLYYREPRPKEDEAKYGYYYDNYRLLTKDLKTQQNMLDILQKDVKYGEYTKFYGSFIGNKIAYKENQQLIIVNLDSKKNQQMIIKNLDSNKDERIYPRDIIAVLPIEYNLNSIYSDNAISPDRQMYARAGGVWTVDNKVVSDFSIKPKRSYLFNIFRR